MKAINGVVYKYTCKTSKKAYIGQTTRGVCMLTQRLREHCYSNPHKRKTAFHHALVKYGKDDFELEILTQTDDIDVLNCMEKYYIHTHKTLAPYGYNLTSGGYNKIVSEETRKRMSCSGKKAMTKQRRKQISNSSKNLIHSKESRNKMSLSHKGLFAGEKHPNSKLTTHDIRFIRHYLFLKYSQYIIAEIFNITQTTVSRIKLGKRWSHID